jgi:hypothetical protein
LLGDKNAKKMGQNDELWSELGNLISYIGGVRTYVCIPRIDLLEKVRIAVEG